MLNKIAILLFATAGLTLGGCFTGIETTPKITAKDVVRAGTVTTPESLIADSILPLPPHRWQSGHRILVVDDRISMVMPGCNISKGDTLRFVGLDSSVSFTGDTTVLLTFRAPRQASPVIYKTGLSDSAFKEASRLDIPFSIDLEMVDKSREALKGRQFYILTAQRLDSIGMNMSGRKFIPVTVTDVIPGSALYPLTIQFSPENSSGIESTPMTALSTSGASRNFDRLFSPTDPRLRFPAVREEFWETIRNSQLAEGMTPDECRLAIGAPADIIKRQDGTSYYERWTFENGSYLLFTDGFLSSWRR